MAKGQTIQPAQKPAAQSGGDGLKFPKPKLPTYPKDATPVKSEVSVNHRVFDGRDIAKNLALNSTQAWMVRVIELSRKNMDVKRLLTEYEQLKQDQSKQ